MIINKENLTVEELEILKDAKCCIDQTSKADATWSCEDGTYLNISYGNALKMFPALLADCFMGHFGRIPSQNDYALIFNLFEKEFFRAIVDQVNIQKKHKIFD